MTEMKLVIGIGLIVIVEALSVIGISKAVIDNKELLLTVERNQKLSIAKQAEIECGLTQEIGRIRAANFTLATDHKNLRERYDKHVRGFQPIGSAPGAPGREESQEIPESINEK